MNLEVSLLQFFTEHHVELGMAHFLSSALSLIVLLVLGAVAGLIIRSVLGSVLRRWALKTETPWDDYLLDQKFFHHLSWVLPVVASYFFLKWFVPVTWTWYHLVSRILLFFIVIFLTGFFNQLLSNFEKGYRSIHADQRLPLRSYIQISRIFLFVVAAVLAVSVLLDQQPWGVLSGIGALTAILVLVFKDALLGFVASLQINSSNIFKLGDWIEIPGQNVEGEITDIALNMVTIKNAENTVFSLPTYNLVSATVKNWRTVTDHGARRLKISLSFDARSVCAMDTEFRQELETKQLWLFPHVELQDPWGFTNLEAFRYFAQAKLDNHSQVLSENPIVVKILDPAGRGVTVEMLFYTPVTTYPEWVNLQSRLMAYFIGSISLFRLQLFQDGFTSL